MTRLVCDMFISYPSDPKHTPPPFLLAGTVRVHDKAYRIRGPIRQNIGDVIQVEVVARCWNHPNGRCVEEQHHPMVVGRTPQLTGLIANPRSGLRHHRALPLSSLPHEQGKVFLHECLHTIPCARVTVLPHNRLANDCKSKMLHNCLISKDIIRWTANCALSFETSANKNQSYSLRLLVWPTTPKKTSHPKKNGTLTTKQNTVQTQSSSWRTNLFLAFAPSFSILRLCIVLHEVWKS